MIHIDGSMMEGGGQLLRMATTYSAILGEPITVENIRSKRSQPGLKPQHLTTLLTAAEISQAEINGASLGSKKIVFKPSRIRGGDYRVDIGTAGSISLLLQCINPILWYADKPTNLSVRGGTAVNWSPPIPLLEHVVYPAYNAMGVESIIEVRRHGFYPRGGGEVAQRTYPVDKLNSLSLSKPDIKRVNGISLCGALPEHVAMRQAKSAMKRLNELRIKTKVSPELAEPRPSGPGSFVVLWCMGSEIFMGADSLGARGKPSEVVGDEAAGKLLAEIKSGTNIDQHTSDHLILPASLSEGETVYSTSKITLHTLTAIEVAKIFTGARFTVEGDEGESGVIKVKGIGFTRRGN